MTVEFDAPSGAGLNRRCWKRMEEGGMQKLLELAGRFGKEEDGAALVEYTVLLGILLVAVIVTIGLVGTWISGKWTALATAIGA